jgi:hypothetical protein
VGLISVVIVFYGLGNVKATHSLKVYVNGGPTKNGNADTLTLLTYDGSTKEKKKAKIARHKHHAEAGQWHKTSVTFEDNKATVVIDGRTFTVSSDKLRQPIEKFGVAHTWGTLHTKDVKIDKTK